MAALHPLKWRLLAEEMVRLRRADEKRRFAASLRRGRIDPNPHQIDAVVFALRRIPEGGCILADEVGLGKTIEAGLVIAQLLAEGKRRVLLIVPKSLLGQWQNELRDLFSIEAREGKPDPEAFAGEGVFLVHREFAGGPKGSSLLCTSDPFDLVVIDEAHELFANIYRRFDKEGNYKDDSDEAQFADRVRSLLKPAQTPVLLLTATPIQNVLTELWGLVQYVEPTNALLGKLPTFREVFCQDKDRSAIAGQEFELRRRLGSVMQRTLRRQAQEFLEVPFAERQTKLIEYSMSALEKDLYNDVTVWLMDPYLCSFACKSRRLLVIAFHRRMASSLAALRSSLEKVADRLRKQLAGAGGQHWDDLADDFARDLEEDLEDLLADEGETDIPHEAPTKERICAELERIEGFIERAESIKGERKADCLLTALKAIADQAARGDGTGKVVIFTESLQTQDFLQNLLTTKGFGPDQITLFRGQNEDHAAKALQCWEEEAGKQLSKAAKPSRQVALRLALVHEFRTRSKVFISTEAGAKGLNLQFCENLINYDLPWNPQRIEQRIGRVHRYGQKRGVVTILSFLDRDNEAQRLTFDILSQKLDLFGKVLDFTDPVLEKASTDFPEPLVSGLGAEFAGQLRRIYGNAKSVEEIASGLRRLRDRMEEKRREFDAEQSRAAQVIETRFDDRVRQAFQRYREDLAGGLEQIDRDLDSLAGTFLEAVGAKFERSETPGPIYYKIRPCAQLPEDYREGGNFLIGRASDSSDGEPLYSGHVLVLAAIAKAREVTARPLAVEVGPGDGALPPCLIPHVGRRGRLVVTKVSYRGIEAADHLLVSAVLESKDTPLTGLTVHSLLALSVVDPPQPEGPPGIDRELLEEAVEESVLEDQIAATAKDDAAFNRKLEQLDRYLEDQILVRKRELAGLERRREEAERKVQSAAAPLALAQRGLEGKLLEGRIEKLEKDIACLQEGNDSDYQQWRNRLFERRYRRPGVERVLEVDFRVAGGGAVTC